VNLSWLCLAKGRWRKHFHSPPRGLFTSTIESLMQVDTLMMGIENENSSWMIHLFTASGDIIIHWDKLLLCTRSQSFLFLPQIDFPSFSHESDSGVLVPSFLTWAREHYSDDSGYKWTSYRNSSHGNFLPCSPSHFESPIIHWSWRQKFIETWKRRRGISSGTDFSIDFCWSAYKRRKLSSKCDYNLLISETVISDCPRHQLKPQVIWERKCQTKGRFEVMPNKLLSYKLDPQQFFSDELFKPETCPSQ
jgi:hypothetical protein